MMEALEHVDATVSVVELKALARRLLPESSPTRSVVERQPDRVPLSDYFVLAKLVSRQLTWELSLGA
jgi:hypothetical protein